MTIENTIPAVEISRVELASSKDLLNLFKTIIKNIANTAARDKKTVLKVLLLADKKTGIKTINVGKAKVINEYLEGKGGRRALAKKYGLIPSSTIKYWLDTRDKNGKLNCLNSYIFKSYT